MNTIHLLLMMTDLEPRQRTSVSSAAQSEPVKADKSRPHVERSAKATVSSKARRQRKQRSDTA